MSGRVRFCAAEVGIDLDRNYRKKRDLRNWYLQDREAMKRGDWTGITGIPAQDMAMWESMGPITDRSEDHFGASDLAVAQFRRMMVAAVKKFREAEYEAYQAPEVKETGIRYPF